MLANALARFHEREKQLRKLSVEFEKHLPSKSIGGCSHWWVSDGFMSLGGWMPAEGARQKGCPHPLQFMT